MDNFIDKTVLSTPKPCASSTMEKKRILKKLDKKYGSRPTDCSNIYEENASSLGIISDIGDKDNFLFSNEDINVQLRKRRELAQSTLERSKIGLPSRYLIPSNTPCSAISKDYDNSMINDSDVLRSQDTGLRTSITSDNFVPSDVSTPKHSNINQASEQHAKPYCEIIHEAAQKVRNPDVSLKDVCSELRRFTMSKSNLQPGLSNLGSELFTPAELMSEKLQKDEQSWRAKKNLPAKFGNIDISNFSSQSNYREKYSVGDFFKQRCEDINNEFFKTSPIKNNPVPLVDLTNTQESEDSDNDIRTSNSSVMSTTEIYRILSEYGTQDAQQILNCFTNKKSGQRKLPALNTTGVSERDVDDYIASKEKTDETKFTIGNSCISTESRQVQTSRPCIITTSPTAISCEDDISKNKYNKFCQNLEVQPTNRLSPRLAENIEKEKSPNTSESRSPHYSKCTTRRISRRYLDTKSPDSLCVPNSLVSSPTENKENISDSDRSLTSVRSGSSLDTLPEGKLPIKSSRLELVWGCLKLGRTSIQEFQIRNQLNQKIRMQASVTGSSFRIVKDSHDTEMLTTTSFILRPLETKTFAVMFCPTIIGAVSEKVCFYPILGGEVQYSKRQTLILFGYGGYACCDFDNVMKDSSGRLWLSLGKIEYQAYIEQQFVIKNIGNLFAFACVDIVTNGPFTFSNIKVEPKEFVMKPLEAVKITVRYYPSKEELKNFKRIDVFEVGHLKIISGAEVIRGRLRRLFAKLRENATPVDPLIERLSKTFAGENMPYDLRYLKESVSAMKELVLQLAFREVTITIEQDLESTLVNPIDIIENSTYYTLCHEEENAWGIGETTIVERGNTRLFNIEPTNIILTLPTKREDTILLCSMSSQEMPFEIKTEPNNLFDVYPAKGLIGPYETLFIKVSFSRNSIGAGSNLGRVLFLIDNQVVEVTVKTIVIKAK